MIPGEAFDNRGHDAAARVNWHVDADREGQEIGSPTDTRDRFLVLRQIRFGSFKQGAAFIRQIQGLLRPVRQDHATMRPCREALG